MRRTWSLKPLLLKAFFFNNLFKLLLLSSCLRYAYYSWFNFVLDWFIFYNYSSSLFQKFLIRKSRVFFLLGKAVGLSQGWNPTIITFPIISALIFLECFSVCVCVFPVVKIWLSDNLLFHAISLLKYYDLRGTFLFWELCSSMGNWMSCVLPSFYYSS